jgi:CBS domain-containing protein
MKVGDLMTKEVRMARADMTIREAAQLMTDFDVGGLPVVKNGNLVGFVTDRDIILRVVAAGVDASMTTVGGAMTQNVVKLDTGRGAGEALAIMNERKIRRVVVTGGGERIAGILSLGDLAARGRIEVGAGQVLGELTGRKK